MLVIIFWKIKTLDKNSCLKQGIIQRPAAFCRKLLHGGGFDRGRRMPSMSG